MEDEEKDIDTLLNEVFNIVEDVDEDGETKTDTDEIDTEVDNEVKTDEDDKDDKTDTDDTDTKTDDTKEETKNSNLDVKTDEGKVNLETTQVKTELAELKKQADADKKALQDMASSYGFTDVPSFLKAFKENKAQQEAEEKGIDPEVYKKQMEQDERISKLEEEKAQAIFDLKVKTISDSLDTAVKDYDLGADGRKVILDKLEKQGYDMDSLLASPNIRLVIDGAMLDKAQEIAQQEQIKKQEKQEKVADDKIGNTAAGGAVMSLDSLIADEMKEFKANYY